MSDVRYRLSDGRVARVKPESAKQQEALWAERGIQFMPLEAPAEPQPMSPGPSFMQPKKSAAPPPAPQQPGAGAAFGRGMGQGASMGFGDEMGGAGAALAGALDPTDIPRQAGRGFGGQQPGPSDYDVGRDTERAANKAAQRAYPTAYGTGELAGSLAPIVAAGGVGGSVAAATTAAPLATAAGTGALLTGLEATGRSDARTAREGALDTGLGAAIGGMGGAAGEVAAPYLSKASGWAANKMDDAARTLHKHWAEQKLAAAGAERGAMKQLRARPGGLERYAEGAERLGIGRNRLGFIPASTRQHADDAAKAVTAAGARKDAASEAIEQAGVGVEGRDVASAVRKLKEQYGKGPAGEAARREIDAIAQGYEEMGTVPFSEMNVERQVWGDATNFDAGSVRQNLRKKIYGALNDSMEQAAERAATPLAGEVAKAPKAAPDIQLTVDDAAYARGDKDIYSIKETAVGRGGPAGVGATGRPGRGGRGVGKTRITPEDGVTPIDVAEHSPSTVALPPPPMAAGTRETVGALDPGTGQAWRGAMEDQHVALKLQELGENKLNQAGNRALSPTDYMAGGLGYAASADPLTAGIAVGANKLARSREHALAANALRGIERGAQAGARGMRGAADLMATAPASARGAVAGEVAAGFRVPSSAMAQSSGQASANGLDDEKYGPLLASKQGKDREAAYSLLLAQDPGFRARQRAKAAQAEGETEQ